MSGGTQREKASRYEKGADHWSRYLRVESTSLVPKLRLGMPVEKLRFESSPNTDAKQSFETCVPKRSLGTRGDGELPDIIHSPTTQSRGCLPDIARFSDWCARHN